MFLSVDCDRLLDKATSSDSKNSESVPTRLGASERNYFCVFVVGVRDWGMTEMRVLTEKQFGFVQG